MRSFSFSTRSALTLSEIAIAMLVITVAFFPIIAVMSNSMKATAKDGSIIVAMNLCQEKLNMALQFPFGHSEFTEGADLKGTYTKGTLELKLGNEDKDGIIYTSTLVISDRIGNFTVPIRKLTGNFDDDPSEWDWETDAAEIAYEGLVHRYRMTVTWKDRGENRVKNYTLVTFKADLEN